MSEFAGQVAVVTGASGALGGALVRRLLGLGAAVETIDRDAGRSERAFADLGAGERLGCSGTDLADFAAVAAVVEAIVGRRDRIDHLFNVAGGFAADGPVEETPLATWERQLDANFRSTLAVCRAVTPVMKRQGGGTIVNVGSRASLRGDAGVAAYAVSKTAVLRLTESLAAEGKAHGVRVNCVLPGTMDTPGNRAAMPDADPSRWVALDAVVDVLLFLASPSARAIHGAALPVFGSE